MMPWISHSSLKQGVLDALAHGERLQYCPNCAKRLAIINYIDGIGSRPEAVIMDLELDKIAGQFGECSRCFVRWRLVWVPCDDFRHYLPGGTDYIMRGLWAEFIPPYSGIRFSLPIPVGGKMYIGEPASL